MGEFQIILSRTIVIENRKETITRDVKELIIIKEVSKEGNERIKEKEKQKSIQEKSETYRFILARNVRNFHVVSGWGKIYNKFFVRDTLSVFVYVTKCVCIYF